MGQLESVRRWALGTTLIGVVLVALQPASAEAQQRIEPVDSLRQIQSIAPRSGPVGTPVEIYSDNMPLEAKFHVGVGATRSGFEALFEATQLGLGEISVTLPVPNAVSWERPIVFVAFNAIFSPIAMSGPFHVTDERGRIQRTGQVLSNSGSCATFEDVDGYAYELVGSTSGLRTGQQVVLEAEYVDESACVDGATIRVVEVRPAP